MLRGLYDWTMALAGRKSAEMWLAIIAFIESSVFLVPADVLFVPMALSRRDRAYRYALVATVASVLGGIAGWMLGYFAYDNIAKPVLAFYGKLDTFESLRASVSFEMILLLLVTSGLAHLPPIKVVTILSGVAGVNLWLFIVSAIVARGARFFFLAWLLRRYGAPIQEFIEKTAGSDCRRRRGRLNSALSRLSMDRALAFETAHVPHRANFALPYPRRAFSGACHGRRRRLGPRLPIHWRLHPLQTLPQQRWPYYIGAPLMALAALSAANGWPLTRALLVIGAALMGYGLYLGIYHSGVEWAFWPGPTDCAAVTSNIETDAENLLNSINETRPPSCDKAALRILGLSMAGWNAVASVVLMSMAIRAAVRR